ncbi:MAG TPA: quinone-dependent dihydroorotate dehydrogenase [Polyangiales bacterium]|nr:quinone-dependent dihydroorotate dehydrogenase [Polyangiales bacterium]
MRAGKGEASLFLGWTKCGNGRAEMFYRWFVRPILYALPAEAAHRLVMGLLAFASGISFIVALTRRLSSLRTPSLEVDAFGLRFPTPIGLAAGLDKDVEAYPMLSAIGFGSVEVGTITAEAQPGNPMPRLFRLIEDRALINRMGFNNHGAVAAARRLADLPARTVPLGINIGKTKRVDNAAALDDYATSARTLAPHADYLVINVSSPNTPGLRDLQAVERLRPLLTRVREELDRARPSRRVPLLLKIAPDLADADIDAIAELALELHLDGIIATNTTIARTGLRTDAAVVSALGAGGLSGAPLKARAIAVLERLHMKLGDRVTLISVGGIENVDDVWDRLRAGARLVQLYTALIYDGPSLPSALGRELRRKLIENGLASVDQIRRF